LQKVNFKDHLQGCVVDAVRHGDEEKVLEDPDHAINQFIR